MRMRALTMPIVRRGSSRRTVRTALSALALGAAWLAFPTAARAAEWKWTIAPYIWASDTSLDVDISNEPTINADVEFPDLIDELDMAGLIHVETRTGEDGKGGGFLLDAAYLDVSGEDTRNGGGVLPSGTEIGTGLKIGIYELGAFLNPVKGLDLIFGVRGLDYKLDIDVDTPSGNFHADLDRDKSYTDGFVGVRARGPIGGKWDLMVRGDVGAGDTDLTWNVIGTVGYTFGEKDQFGVRAGWRQMVIETSDVSSDDSTTDADLTLKGPYIGFTWTF